MSTHGLEYCRIVSAGDALWPHWLALYLDAFPEAERMSEGYFLALFSGGAAKAGSPVVAVLKPRETSPVGLYHYVVQETDSGLAAWLYYIAVRADERSAGIGRRMMQRIESECREARVALLVWEVEIPSREDPALDANRRIRFYRQNGAFLVCGGIRYLQTTDQSTEALPMWLMGKQLDGGSAVTAGDLVGIFGDGITITGPLELATPDCDRGWPPAAL